MIAIDVQVVFYSPHDEDAFFEWVKKIPCITTFDPVTLFVRSKVMSNENLRDLTALLFRYGAEMSQLQQFCNSRNESWFKEPHKYWHESVFGGAKHATGHKPASRKT